MFPRTRILKKIPPFDTFTETPLTPILLPVMKARNESLLAARSAIGTASHHRILLKGISSKRSLLPSAALCSPEATQDHALTADSARQSAGADPTSLSWEGCLLSSDPTFNLRPATPATF